MEAEHGMQPVGYAIARVLLACGIEHVPLVYVRAVADMQLLRRVQVPFQRPQSKVADITRWHSSGAFTKVPPEQRLVSEELDPWKHVAKAKVLEYPQKKRSSAGALHEAVAVEVTRMGASLEKVRDATIERWQSIASTLDHLEQTIRSHISPEFSAVMGHSGIATVAAAVEAFGYPDVELPWLLFSGFDAGGDGHLDGVGVRESFVLRKGGKTAKYSLAELHAGLAEKDEPHVLDEQTGELEEAERWPSSSVWLHDMSGRIRRQAELVLKRQGVSLPAMQQAAKADLAESPKKGGGGRVDAIIESLPRGEDRDTLASLWTLERKCMDETQSSPATMSAPMGLKRYREWAEPHGGIEQIRPARRHCIEQGEDEHGKTKYRCVDDFRRNGVKGATTLPEDIDLPTFMCVVWIASAFAKARKQLGVAASDALVMTLALEDMKTAYRMVPQRLAAVRVVSWYSFRMGMVVHQLIYGHSYGQLAAVYNFPRVPRLVCYVLAVVFLVAARDYVDDFMLVDLACGGASGHRSIVALMATLGFLLDAVKRQHAEVSNVALGSLVDLSRLPTDMVVTFEPWPKKLKKLFKRITACRDAKHITAGTASEINGKLRWFTTHTKGRAGAAAAQPFQDRSLDEVSGDWTVAMEHSLEFIELLFEEGHMPKMVVPVEDGVQRKPIILYTDASFMWATGKDGSIYPHAFVCMWLFDQESGAEIALNEYIPPYYYDHFARDKDTYIAQVELLAVVSALYTRPDVFAGRRVIHFCDNTVALSALVHGYAKKEDMARMVNAFHLAATALDVDFYHEWVPSKANVADIPTRPDRMHEIPSHVKLGKMKLPPISGDAGALRRWRDMMEWLAKQAAREI